MKHEITLTQTDDQWTQVMVCEFANATIAELIWQDTAIGYRAHKECLLVDGEAKAELQREGETITATCKKQDRFTRCWDTDSDTNKQELVELAYEWKKQEQMWLPLMRYFKAGAKEYNISFRQWANKREKELAELENQIKVEQLKRKGDVKFCEGQITKLLENLLEIEGQMHDLLDSLEMDFNQIERLKEALALHRGFRFHFLDKK